MQIMVWMKKKKALRGVITLLYPRARFMHDTPLCLSEKHSSGQEQWSLGKWCVCVCVNKIQTPLHSCAMDIPPKLKKGATINSGWVASKQINYLWTMNIAYRSPQKNCCCRSFISQWIQIYSAGYPLEFWSHFSHTSVGTRTDTWHRNNKNTSIFTTWNRSPTLLKPRATSRVQNNPKGYLFDIIFPNFCCRINHLLIMRRHTTSTWFDET